MIVYFTFLMKEWSRGPKANSKGELWVNVVWQDNINAPCCFYETGLWFRRRVYVILTLKMVKIIDAIVQILLQDVVLNVS